MQTGRAKTAAKVKQLVVDDSNFDSVQPAKPRASLSLEPHLEDPLDSDDAQFD